MRKAIIGLAAVAAAIALRPPVTRLAQKVLAHCEQMAAQHDERSEALVPA